MDGIKMIRVRDNGDATTTYNIEVTKEMLLTEFCENVVESNPKEWGSIFVASLVLLVTFALKKALNKPRKSREPCLIPQLTSYLSL